MKDSRLKRALLRLWDQLHIGKEFLSVRCRYRLPIMSTEKTIAYICKHNCSIARFGDGEFGLMLQTHGIGFQEKSPELAESLKKVVCDAPKELLICVPGYLNSTRGCTPKAKTYWKSWSVDNQKKVVTMIRQLAPKAEYFGDALLSRPYMDRNDPRFAAAVFSQIRELWSGRDILIVEGSRTCLGIGNDLFSNTKSIKRILCPSKNAFSKLQQISEAVSADWKGELVILSLGPTATVLACELSKKGIQALDIGHIDVEYEWYRMGASQKIAVAGKNVNEAKGGDHSSECRDPRYQAQIIRNLED